MPAVSRSKFLIQAGWDDVPHITEDAKRDLLEGTPPHLRDARSKGTPSLGSGAIYPVAESEFVVEPFEIPAYWPRAYALDVGWKKTACIWGAIDRNIDCAYLFTEHYLGEATPAVHSRAIQGRGDWIPGVIDPAARGRGQRDGEQLLSDYLNLGLKVQPANNAVESGLWEVLERLQTGRLKVFSTCRNWLNEYRIYRRDEKGRIVKENDHLMDATRYLIVSGLKRAITQPIKRTRNTGRASIGDSVAGY